MEYILIIIISIAELCVGYYKNFKESCVILIIEKKILSVILAFPGNSKVKVKKEIRNTRHNFIS